MHGIRKPRWTPILMKYRKDLRRKATDAPAEICKGRAKRPCDNSDLFDDRQFESLDRPEVRKRPSRAMRQNRLTTRNPRTRTSRNRTRNPKLSLPGLRDFFS